eukprot:1679296-Lingulodinium_polyedra.AAC.1
MHEPGCLEDIHNEPGPWPESRLQQGMHSNVHGVVQHLVGLCKGVLGPGSAPLGWLHTSLTSLLGQGLEAETPGGPGQPPLRQAHEDVCSSPAVPAGIVVPGCIQPPHP